MYSKQHRDMFYRLVVLLLCVSGHISLMAQNYLSGYPYRNAITILGDQVPAPAEDFPVLIIIAQDAFANNIETNARIDGFDIVFTDSDGFTKLDHELQAYNEEDNQLIAWVKVDLTGDDQVIYIYYGNPEIATDQSTKEVWSNGFRAVWHLEEDPNGDRSEAILDDSGFDNHGTPNGAMTTSDLITGQIGYGLDLDGIDDFVAVVNSSSLQITDNTITLSAWVNISPGVGEDEGIILKGTFNDESYLLGTGGTTHDQVRLRINNSENNSQAGTIPSTNTWHYIVGVYDGNNRIGYIDAGLPEFTTPMTENIEHDPLDPIYLGRRADVAEVRYYEGLMDELRISDSPRSVEWIQTEFNNQSAPSNFIDIGVQETCVTPVPNGGIVTATNQFILPQNSTTITLSGQTEGTIIWQESLNNIDFSDATGGTGQGTSTYTTPLLSEDIYYRALITSTGGCVAADVTSTVTEINIVPAYGIEDYSRRKRIIIDHTQICGNTDLTDFPVLVLSKENDLKHTSNAGGMSNIGGYDIAFTLNDGTSRLDHDLESYDPETGELVVWVRLPTLSHTADTEIYMYYGNPSITVDQSVSTTWDANYAAIWHLNNNLQDATTHEQHGTDMGGITNITGRIGGGRSFDGEDDYAIIPHEDGSSLDITGNQITLEAWVKARVNSADSPFLVKAPSVNNERYMLGIQGQTNFINTRVTTDTGHFRDDSGPINVEDWTHIVFVYDGNLAGNPRKLLYANGTLIDAYNASGDILSTTEPLHIGKRATTDERFFWGILDELRVSNTARSADWICTEYNNQNSPLSFFTIGDEQPCTPAVDGGTAEAVETGVIWKTPTTINLTGNTGNVIQWQASPDSINFSDLPGEISTTLRTEPITRTMFYRAKVSNGTCESVSTLATVSVRASDRVEVYPNPSRDNIVVLFDDRFVDTETTISLINMTGGLVWQQRILVNQFQVNLSFGPEISNGLYILRLDNSNSAESKRLLIQQ